jgi:hypothetical protein
MTNYENLWCVVESNDLKDQKGNINGHVWRNEEEACAQADALALNGNNSIVFKMLPSSISKVTGVVRERFQPEIKKSNQILDPTKKVFKKLKTKQNVKSNKGQTNVLKKSKKIVKVQPKSSTVKKPTLKSKKR